MKRLFNTLMLIMGVILFTSCADAVTIDTCTTTDPYGFFSGIWHGLIVWFSFIGSLFSDDITIYAVNNTGGWYDFGFMVGISAFACGPAVNSRR